MPSNSSKQSPNIIMGDSEDSDEIARAEKYRLARERILGASEPQEEIKQPIILIPQPVGDTVTIEMPKVPVDSIFKKFVPKEIENEIAAEQIEDQQQHIASQLAGQLNLANFDIAGASNSFPLLPLPLLFNNSNLNISNQYPIQQPFMYPIQQIKMISIQDNQIINK
ncbi:MAG: hypothetical protein EZS28_017683 [Streblomastix strix]|uniref:SUZ domain-containing protein n=1 Tax=Streblomastix strix TaxID=222440 RepID=A0A5J4VWC2_9EUKA|nr:MAG: hypothetical protein EZS28_017683 [Streblomastix strix]